MIRVLTKIDMQLYTLDLLLFEGLQCVFLILTHLVDSCSVIKKTTKKISRLCATRSSIIQVLVDDRLYLDCHG